MVKINAIVFDWDGTIVNTMPLKIKNASEIFTEYYDVPTEDAAESYKKYSGVSRRELFNLIAKENIGKELSTFVFNRLSAEFTSRNIDSYKKNKVFDENNREALLWFSEQKMMLFISSSAVKDEIEELAEYLDLKKFFNEILGSSGNFKKGKPHINYIKNKFNLVTSQIMFVGDEKPDMRLANRLGVMCVGISNGKPKDTLYTEFADYVMHNLIELKEFLGGV